MLLRELVPEEGVVVVVDNRSIRSCKKLGFWRTKIRYTIETIVPMTPRTIPAVARPVPLVQPPDRSMRVRALLAKMSAIGPRMIPRYPAQVSEIIPTTSEAIASPSVFGPDHGGATGWP